MGAKEEEEGTLSSSLLLLLFPSHLSTCPVCPKTRPASCWPQSSSSLDTLVAMSLKAKGAPHRRLNLTPLLWPSPLGSWQTSASNATRAPAAPWVQDRRKGPARWTWQPQPCAASRRASTTSAGSRGLRTLTSQPHRGVRGSAAFWCPDIWRLQGEGATWREGAAENRWRESKIKNGRWRGDQKEWMDKQIWYKLELIWVF